MTENEIDRHAHDIVRHFRGLNPNETPIQYAQCVAHEAIAATLKMVNGEKIVGAQDDLTALLARANMSIYHYGTRAVASTPNDGSAILVRSSSAIPWEDCVEVLFRREGDEPGCWRIGAVLSPARARLVAKLLIEAAEAHEAREGVGCIDKDRS